MAPFVIGVMARAPVPGQCKTRLARTLGDEAAAHLYDAMLRDTLDAVAAIDAHRVILAACENDGVATLSALAPPGFDVVPQRSGDLGARLGGAFRDLLMGAAPVVVVGSDAPLAPLTAIRPALAAQRAAPWVLAGPTDDGGYWSIAMPVLVPTVFEGIPWSTAQVLEETRARRQLQARWGSRSRLQRCEHPRIPACHSGARRFNAEIAGPFSGSPCGV